MKRWITRAKALGLVRKMARRLRRRQDGRDGLLQHKLMQYGTTIDTQNRLIGELEEKLAAMERTADDWKGRAQSTRSAKAIWDALGRLQKETQSLVGEIDGAKRAIGKAYEIDDAIRN